jgi:hypothetical protein
MKSRLVPRIYRLNLSYGSAMKTCFKCGVVKPRSEFYGHPRMADGLLGKCKECAKADVLANRANRAEHYRAFDRQRSDFEPRVALRRSVARSRRLDPAKRQADLKSRERWADRNFVKRRAHFIVARAIRSGRLQRPPGCSRCGGNCTPHAHHEDYYRPLEVEWLCGDCHGLRHREINEEIRCGADLRCRGFDLAEPAERLSA